MRRRTCYVPDLHGNVALPYFTEVERDGWDDVFTPLGDTNKLAFTIFRQIYMKILTWPDPITFTNEVFPDAFGHERKGGQTLPVG